jgi:hypothetical protein
MNISDKQFVGLVGDGLAGGFTAIPNGRFAGQPPRNKLLVGQKDSPEGEANTGPGIASYAREHAETLDKPNRFLGGWGTRGTVVLDVPKGFPDTPKGETAARRSTLTNDQEAYGRMGRDREYAGTTYNPYHANHRDPFNPANTPDPHESPETEATKYFAGDRRLWTRQPLKRRQ